MFQCIIQQRNGWIHVPNQEYRDVFPGNSMLCESRHKSCKEMSGDLIVCSSSFPPKSFSLLVLPRLRLKSQNCETSVRQFVRSSERLVRDVKLLKHMANNRGMKWRGELYAAMK